MVFNEVNRVLIKNCTVVGGDSGVDILIEDGVIKEIGNVKSKVDKVVDLKGAFVSPGWADVHVHFREPGREDEETIESGLDAAMAGGFTAVCSMPNTDPVIDSADMVASIKKSAAGHLVDLHPIGAITKGLGGENLAEIGDMFQAGAVGFSDDGRPVSNSLVMRNAIDYSGMFNVPIINHAEVESLSEGGVMHESTLSSTLGIPGIPSQAEDIMVMRDIRLLEMTEGRLHVPHVSTKESVEFIRAAKKKGLNVTSEVTPHHISLTDEELSTFSTNLKMNPPLRTEADRLALIDGLKDGTIDCIATDHAPHSIEEKEGDLLQAPFGIVGLETAFAISSMNLLDTKVLDLEQLIEKLSTNPRKIFGLDEVKIEVGANANITFFNPDKEWTVDSAEFYSRSRNTPYIGKKVKGKVLGVINRNKLFLHQKIG